MRVLVTGIDGYLGWSLAVYLAAREHEVGGIDNFSRRKWVCQEGAHSILPIAEMHQRAVAFVERFKPWPALTFYQGNLCAPEFVERVYREFRPDAIVYLGEQPSAAFSMKDVEHATMTQANNVLGTLATLHVMRDVCPEAHLVKLGTMGEYGTPKDCPIPEGRFAEGSLWIDGFAPSYAGDVRVIGDLSGMMFPRQAGSWYHQSKVHDTHNVEMACRLWGLRSTDVMQGVVYGARIDEMGEDLRLLTRFDIDECFGTVINRFVAQAVIGHPLTVYGEGGQTRGYLPLRESMECLSIALENPPKSGEYRTFNQFAQTHSVNELAGVVKTVGDGLGMGVTIKRIPNPRIEQEKHDYHPDCQRLAELGYTPSGNLEADVREMFGVLLPYRERIEQVKAALLPMIQWGRPA